MAGLGESSGAIVSNNVADDTLFINFLEVKASRKAVAGMWLCTHKGGGTCLNRKWLLELCQTIGSLNKGYYLYI